MSSRAADERVKLGVVAVFSLAVAASRLPWGDSASRRWLYEQGLVYEAVVDGKSRHTVIWGDVLDALRGQGHKPGPDIQRPTEPPVEFLSGLPAVDLG